MILSFDKFERYELPQVTLCNPNSRATEVNGKITITDTVGVLSNPKGMNLKLNFNAPHELSFDYYRHKSSDPIKQSFYDSIYEAIQTDRYVYLTDIGYFVISSVTDSDEDNIDRKSISLKSCEENELATAEGLHLKEGTYYLHTENNDGLLDLFFPKTAGWTIGYIDPSLLTKPYFVEDTEVDNGYNFLYTTIQDMFECIVEPDIIKRTISVYSRAYYAEHHLTDIHIAKHNLLKHKTVEENDEDKYTALNVQGKDENLEIRAVNPTGKNVIYNFEPRYAWMSSALQQAIEKWQEKCESVEEEYLTLQQGYYTELEKLFNEEQDIEVLKGELKTLEETRDAVLITTGEEQSTALDNVNAQISAKQTEINTATSNYNTHKTIVQVTYEEPIGQINKDCALDITAVDIDGNIIFTTELLNELMTHIKPTDYVDEYMLVTESMTYPQKFEKAKELMDRAQSQLVKISSGQKTYSIDTRSFLFNKQFKHFSEQLCAGAIIYVETKNDTMEQLHLTSIDINFDEKSTNFTLGNKYDRSDLKALYEDALGKNSKSFSELQYIASIIEDQQKQLDYQRNWVADLRTLTLDNVLTSEDQAIEINNRGLIGRKRRLDENGEWDFDENGNPYFEDEQVKLINNTLVFTEDNWKTASTAVGKIAVGYNSDGSVKYSYGINGQVLIGELILGNNLILTGTGAGIKIKDSNGNDAFYADDDGNLVLSGTIFASAGKIGGFNIQRDSFSYIRDIYKNHPDPHGTFGSVFFYPESKEYTLSNIAREAQNWCLTIGTSFGVTEEGKLFAISGEMGGWSVDSRSYNGGPGGLYNISSVPNSHYNMIGFWPYHTGYEKGGKQIAISVGRTGVYETDANGELKFKNPPDFSNTPFIVYHDGSIEAKAGEIARWTIGTNWLQSANIHAASLHENGIALGFDGDTPRIVVRKWSQNSSGTWVYTDYLNINGAGGDSYIAGWKITAGGFSSGKVGVWKENYHIDSHGQLAFTAGSGIVAQAPFRVYHNGDMVCNNASIKGTIQAGSIIGGNNMKLVADDNGMSIGLDGVYQGHGGLGPWLKIGSTSSEYKYSALGYNYTKNGEIYLFRALYVNANGNYSDGDFMPTGDSQGTIGGQNLGGPSNRWKNIYARTTTISTSDRNEKQDIVLMEDKYSSFYDSLTPVSYKYIINDSNRTHVGFISQDVEDALINNGLTSLDFAGFIKSPLKDGTYSYGLRYSEFIALNTWQIQKAKARITELENKVAELKTQIQTLTAG